MKTILLFVMSLALTSPLFAGEGGEEVYIREGTHYLAVGNYTKAAKTFEYAVKINPGSADAFAGLGTSYMRLGNNEAMTIPEMLEKAVTAFNKSLDINQDNADVLYNLGQTYLALDQKDAAQKQHAKLISLDSKKAGALILRINAHTPPKNYNYRPMGASQGDDNNSTRVQITENQVRVPVRLSYRNNNVDVWLVLDTGATTTMITSTVADRLGIKPENTDRMLAKVADGSMVKAFSTHVDYIAVGPKLKHNLRIAIMPVKDSAFAFGDGLLGMNFLGNYKYHLDMRTQTIEWQ